MDNNTNNVNTQNADTAAQPTTKIVAVSKKRSWKRTLLLGTAGVAVLGAVGATAFALIKGKGGIVLAAAEGASAFCTKG